MKKKLGELALQFPVLDEKAMKSFNGGSDETPWDRYNNWGAVGANGGYGGYNSSWGTYSGSGGGGTTGGSSSTPTSPCPPGLNVITIPGFMTVASSWYCG